MHNARGQKPLLHHPSALVQRRRVPRQLDPVREHGELHVPVGEVTVEDERRAHERVSVGEDTREGGGAVGGRDVAQAVAVHFAHGDRFLGPVLGRVLDDALQVKLLDIQLCKPVETRHVPQRVNPHIRSAELAGDIHGVRETLRKIFHLDGRLKVFVVGFEQLQRVFGPPHMTECGVHCYWAVGFDQLSFDKVDAIAVGAITSLHLEQSSWYPIILLP